METETCAIINASTRKMNKLKNEAMFGRSRKKLTDKEGRERERERGTREEGRGRERKGRDMYCTCNIHCQYLTTNNGTKCHHNKRKIISRIKAMPYS